MKGMNSVLSSTNLKSIHSACLRSIPKVQRSVYLELYMLKREKDRLEKENFALDKRRSSAGNKLQSIDKRMEELEREAHRQKTGSDRNSPARTVRKMAVNY